MLCSEADVQRIATNLFKKYSNGVKMSENNLSRMLTDLYSDLEKDIEIGPDQVEEYKKVLDVDQDSVVSFEDIHGLVKRYLMGDDVKTDNNNHEIEEVIESTVVTTFHLSSKVETKQQEIQPQTVVTESKQVKKVDKAPKEEPQRKYNQRTMNKLDLAKRLFNQFQQNGFITQYEVPGFLRETYKNIGLAQEITRDDVAQWMVMADRNNDGRVYYEDFEIMLIESLKESGLDIFQ